MSLSTEQNTILVLSNEKLSLLNQIYENLIELDHEISQGNDTDFQPYLSKQYELIGLVDSIEKQIAPLLKCYPDMRQKIEHIVNQQREILKNSLCLNNLIASKGEALKQKYSNKIRGFNRGKNIISRYCTERRKPGFLINFKEENCSRSYTDEEHRLLCRL